MAAGGGTRELLMVHIPMAFIIIGVAGRLYRASRTTPTRRTS
jgi:hypothetical protein